MSPVRRDLLDVRRNVLDLGEVDIFLRLELVEAELALFVSAVDGDDAHAHRDGVLDAD